MGETTKTMRGISKALFRMANQLERETPETMDAGDLNALMLDIRDYAAQLSENADAIDYLLKEVD